MLMHSLFTAEYPDKFISGSDIIMMHMSAVKFKSVTAALTTDIPSTSKSFLVAEMYWHLAGCSAGFQSFVQ